VEVDDDAVSFVVYPTENAGIHQSFGEEEVLLKMSQFIQTGGPAVEEWLYPEIAECTLADMEVEELVTQEEMLNLSRTIPEEARTSHLDAVVSPDGVLRKPMHEGSVPALAKVAEGTESAKTAEEQVAFSPAARHQQRDPGLFELDNVARVDISQIESMSWTTPVIITGCMVGSLQPSEDLTKANVVEHFGDVEVLTGNRDTLVDNGFSNSKPMTLREALTQQGVEDAIGGVYSSDPEYSRIVFSPVRDLPEIFQQALEVFTKAFPAQHTKKFTLTLANEGFGIGMHKHGPAMFLLVTGKKKWYMGSEEVVFSPENADTPTHPGFYTHKSSHKCIQKSGELLYVPDQWYHEIFNLEYTAGIQALPDI